MQLVLFSRDIEHTIQPGDTAVDRVSDGRILYIRIRRTADAAVKLVFHSCAGSFSEVKLGTG